jgi:predicted negative regulator of RcsB-dependent stress response
MDELDEHEQGERVRQWLRQNGGSIILGIGAGIAALAGWQYWKSTERDRTARAQVEFRALLDAETANDAEAAAKAAATLREDYANTPYGVFAALGQARDAVKKGDLAAARQSLEWAHGAKVSLPALAQLVDLRLAQVKLAQGEAQAAVELLEGLSSGGYKGPAAELRGDALVALGRIDDARVAYEDALAALDSGNSQRDFVTMKRDDLPAAAAAAPAATPAATPATPAAPPAAADAAKGNS